MSDDGDYCEDDDHVYVSRRLFHHLIALWAIAGLLFFLVCTGFAVAHNVKKLVEKPVNVKCVTAAPKVSVTVLPKTLPYTP